MTAAPHDANGHHDDGHGHALPDTAVSVAPVRTVSLVMLAVGLVGFVALSAVQWSVSDETALKDVFGAYLVGFLFWACIPFGSFGLSGLGFVTTASWGVVFRRVFQANLRTLPLIAVLFLPIAVSLFIDGGKASPFWWADTGWTHPGDDVSLSQVQELTEQKWSEEVARVAVKMHTAPLQAEENQHKIHDWLNKPFFIARTVAYFVLIGGFAYFLLRWVRRVEDADDARAMYNIRGLAGPVVLVWALSGTFIVTDWVMSVEPTWASSMFPVVFAMNQFICTFSVSALAVYGLAGGKADVIGIVKDKFRIDIGSLLFAFTMLWAYATFSQYMLVWAGNLPEEISYYRKRADHGWQYMAYFLMLFHWLFPFVLFLFREIKTDTRIMQRMCVLLLAVCATDVVWWIIPAWPHPHGGVHVPMALAAVLAVGGVWGLMFARELGRRPILATNNEVKFLAAWGHHH